MRIRSLQNVDFFYEKPPTNLKNFSMFEHKSGNF